MKKQTKVIIANLAHKSQISPENDHPHKRNPKYPQFYIKRNGRKEKRRRGIPG